MKKKIAAALLALTALLPGCAQSTAVKVPAEAPLAQPGVTAGRELFCLAESEEKAREIAALYGIELVSFGDGVATFHTEEDLYAVIRRGQEKGWPLLEANKTMQLY